MKATITSTKFQHKRKVIILSNAHAHFFKSCVQCQPKTYENDHKNVLRNSPTLPQYLIIAIATTMPLLD